MRELIDLIKESKYFVAFTGAGISTLSGIKDFRGKNGLYNSKDIDADKIFSLSYFMKDPSYFYTNSKNFIYDIDSKGPNIIHKELARLEKKGILKALITQNIDMLHEKAGSENVIEVHGSASSHKCLSCGKKYGFDEVSVIVNDDKVPRCENCGGIIKPEIIFFEEPLNATSIEMAVHEASRADLMLVLGSSLQVQPAASIPLHTLDNRGKLIIINDMETPLDRYAELKYENLEKCFSGIASAF
ncbi:MAG: NAD-dependent deacetylase [Lentisphaerae bacterium GWF2_44_16]|nr:MAG: NAD-dependent deacetylase [Lentisphaerae bacterium GWF2_44_16]